ncbi:MAG TPA: EAL domain-containing protein [Jatrophihabitans sp.]|nr:EAL domain-containing protein [Jatrophihabitans sp.]
MTNKLRSLLRTGGRLRGRLIILILIPVLGMLLAAGAQVTSRINSADAARNAESRIRNAAAADAVRSAFEQEVVPAFAAAVARQPGLIETRLSPAQLAQALSIVGQLPELRATTSAALARLSARPGMAAAGATLRQQLTAVRTEIDTAKSLQDGLTGPEQLLSTVTGIENTQIRMADRSGLSPAAAQALQDLDLTAHATQVGAEEILLFCSTKFNIPAANKGELQRDWTTNWADYASAVSTLLGRGSPVAAQAWQQAMAHPQVRSYDDYLAADALAPRPVAMPRLLMLVNEDGMRNQLFAGLLAGSVDRALAAGNAQHQRANLDLLWIVLACLILLALSVAGLTLVQRSVSRPLQSLAAQAKQISQGELIDVHAGGPYEVRTVAMALESTVASLRNIQAQAAAVAAGELNSPVLQTSLPGPLGEVVHSSVETIVSAINERELAKGELAHRASHDALTELPNRAQAMVLIEQALHRAQRANTKTALMFIDLDRFKAVNDTHGHAAGDEVLRAAAHRMRSAVREGDIVARLGGDEFIVLLEGISDEADTVALAERIVSLTAHPVTVGEREVRIGASVGLAFCRDGSVDADHLLQEADAAAYRAKNAGRDRVEVFDDVLRTQLRERAELESAIRAGLAANEFLLHYQPVVNLLTGAVDGLEALIRWERPGFGMVPPVEFIPVAEQSPLVNDIGRWVLAEACGQLARWQQDGVVDEQLTVSVNISGRHVASTDFVLDVQAALAVAQLAPNRLIVEITETVLVDDPMATRNMSAIRELGVQIAIDDFGTGFTSIGQLPRLPVDSLKIDRSFVASTEPAHAELVRLIVAAAHAFGLTVVAEGIEHDAQADGLRALSVENGQGYLFSRPRPADALFGTRPIAVG